MSLRIVNQRSVKPAAKALHDEGDRIWVRSKSNEGDLAKAADLFSRALKEDKQFSRICDRQAAQGQMLKAYTRHVVEKYADERIAPPKIDRI